MNEITRNRNTKDKSQLFYKTPVEFIQDYLDRLNILIELALCRSINDDDVDAGYIIRIDKIRCLLKNKSEIENKEDKVDLYEKLIVQLEEKTELTRDKLANSIKQDIYLPVNNLFNFFNLDHLELDVIFICLAPLIDPEYKIIYAYLQDDSTKKYPCIELIYLLMNADLELKSNILKILSDYNTLIYWQFIEFDKNSNTDKNDIYLPLRIDQSIASYLFGKDAVDNKLSGYVKVIENELDLNDVFIKDDLKLQFNRIADNIKKEKLKYLFHFTGTCRLAKIKTAGAIVNNAGKLLLYVDIKALVLNEPAHVNLFRRLVRLTRLFNYVLFIDNFDVFDSTESSILLDKEELLENIQQYETLCFVSTDAANPMITKTPAYGQSFIHINFDKPGYKLRKQIWEYYLSEANGQVDIKSLTAKFILTEQQIIDAIGLAIKLDFEEGLEQALYYACKKQSGNILNNHAVKIQHGFSMKDIILPDDTFFQLQDVIDFHQFQNPVYEDWGFHKKLPYGRGLTVLFSGPSGTGKTMAAGIIGNELKLDVYKIDLATVVSKYIGETEKNLRNIFMEAKSSNVILFFDEADAIFGKRTEVKDSHDRYANIETSYLLQMMEDYEGMSILATNFRDNIDKAFTRRLKFIIDFPFPEEEYRKKIWQAVFPGEAPLSSDIDFDFIAGKVVTSGGDIKSMALMSAMYAVKDKDKIKMKHIILSVRKFFKRKGKRFIEADFQPYSRLLK